MSDDAQKAEELLSQSSDQRRHNTEPTESELSQDGEATEMLTLKDAIKQQYEQIDAGETPQNLTIRDENLVALLDGLAEYGDLEDIVEEASESLGRDHGSVSRSEAARLLIRVGIAEIDSDVVETAIDARTEYEAEDITF